MKYVATLAFGLLGRNSRIERAITGQRASYQEMLLASCVDRLGILAWQNTADGQKGRNKPPSVLDAITKDTQREQKKYKCFKSPEEFKAEWARLTEV